MGPPDRRSVVGSGIGSPRDRRVTPEPPDLFQGPSADQKEDEVVRAAAEHAASAHGHDDTPELREQVREFLEPAESYSNAPREPEPLPG
jgi:hypothetical protein